MHNACGRAHSKSLLPTSRTLLPSNLVVEFHYGDVLFSDDEMKRGEVHARITRKDGDVCDIVWSISEAQDGWKINYFVAGRRFPPNYP